MQSRDDGLQKKKISSQLTNFSNQNEMHEQEESNPQSIPEDFTIIILPFKCFLKIMYKVENLQHIFFGILVRSNGQHLETKNILSFEQFSLLWKEKTLAKNPLFYFCEKTQAIKMVYHHPFNPENQMESSNILRKFREEIEKIKKNLLKVLQILGIVKIFSKTRKQLQYFELEDKKTFKKLIPSHRLNEKNCCQRQQQNHFLQKPFQGQCIKKVKNIIFQQMNENNREKFVVGSFCKIKKQSVMIESVEKQNQSQRQNQIIAIKTLKNQYKNDKQKWEKIIHERKIISQLTQSKYIINFIEPLNRRNEEQVYLEYIEQNLKEKMSYFSFSLYQKLCISQQILKAIISLHEDGVVHRDLKPQNILINKKNKIKLIDFSQSIQIGSKFNRNIPNKLGCTIPYSPLQCGTFCEEGYSNSKIDNWSVGIIICELIQKKLPFSYPRLFEKEIKKNWIKNDQFYLNLNLRQKKGMSSVEGYLKLLVYLLIHQKQAERYCLAGALQILEVIHRRFKKIFHI